eukprot:7206925-Pyramimonas_sp.AAC.1
MGRVRSEAVLVQNHPIMVAELVRQDPATLPHPRARGALIATTTSFPVKLVGLWCGAAGVTCLRGSVGGESANSCGKSDGSNATGATWDSYFNVYVPESCVKGFDCASRRRGDGYPRGAVAAVDRAGARAHCEVDEAEGPGEHLRRPNGCKTSRR